MKPRIAIITRTKDRPELLPRALESVLAQTETAWEHLIVNDGGEASALEALLEPFRERYGQRLQVLHHETSLGMQVAGNAGIAASTAPYIAIHDDDDRWVPEFLEKALKFLEAAGTESLYQGVICHTVQITERIEADGEVVEESRRTYLPLPEISLFRLGYENPFPPIAFCYRRSAYDAIGPYDERFTVAGDYDFNFRFLRRFEIGVIPEPLAFYHVRSRSATPQSANSIATGASEHKRRYNEFKNYHLRGDDALVDPAQRLALNAAKYLVELEWVAHDIHRETERIRVVEDRLEHGLAQNDASFAQLLKQAADSRARVEEIWNDPRARERLDALLKDLSHTNEVLGHLDEVAAKQVVLLERLARDVSHSNDVLGNLEGLSAREFSQIERREGELSTRQDQLARDLAFSNQLLGSLQTVAAELREQLGGIGESQSRSLDNLSRDLSYTNDQLGELRASQSEGLEALRVGLSEGRDALRAGLDQNREELRSRIEQFLRELESSSQAEREQLLAQLRPILGEQRQSVEAVGQTLHQLGAAVESRAVDILKEIQQHHIAMHQAMKERTLLQFGPLRLSWKSKRRAPRPTPDESSREG